MPRVSVVVSHYERQALLVEALDSIAAQSYRDFEIVVVNDAGADSERVVRDAAARHPGLVVRYQRQPVNRGVAATRNAGVALAVGELIAYLDDDDLWRRHHLASLVGALDAHPDAALAYGDAEIWRMECDHAPRVDEWRCAARRTLAVPFDLDHLRRDDFVVPGGMVHHRSLYDAVGPFDETLFVSDDWDWLLRAAAVTRFVRVPEVVVTVRIWSDRTNLSADAGARRLHALAEIERRHATGRLEPKTFWEVAETYAAKHTRRDAAHAEPPAP
jgi:glycosyltransferase involved in cell wall biosynthesis